MTIQKDSLIPGRSVVMYTTEGEDSPLKKVPGKIVVVDHASGICGIKGFDGKNTVTEMPLGRAAHVLNLKNRKA